MERPSQTKEQSKYVQQPSLQHHEPVVTTNIFKKLSITNRILTPLILVTMILGVIVGEFAPNVQKAFDVAQFDGVSAPIAAGLIVMMWPTLANVQYETLPTIFTSRRIWVQIMLSFILNWIIGPFIMLGLAWATLPDLPTYRAGLILVGLARCIAMVMIWNQLARGDGTYCAILVVINATLQILLYSPFSVLFINIIGNGKNESSIRLSYRQVAVSVAIYLGVPLVAGVITRYGVWCLTSKSFLQKRFLPIFSQLSMIGLLYTIFVMLAYQGHHVVHNIRRVLRVFVPLILYFVIMWTLTFALVYVLSRKHSRSGQQLFGYEMAVVQAFTAASNNFELAIAVSIAVYGVGSDQALAAAIGPLVEVPVLLALTWVSLYLGKKLDWKESGSISSQEKSDQEV